MRLDITVIGRPAPQGSHGLGSAGQFLDASPYLAAWRRAVKIGAYQAYRQAGLSASLPVFPAGTPVTVERCTFYVDREQCRAAGTDEPVGDPDIDKLLRATLDALGGAKKETARLFADDAQVVAIRDLSKTRAMADPGALIIVSDGRD